MIHNGVMTRQETICEKFPMEMVHNSVMTRQKTVRKKFPMEVIRSGTMPDWKPCKAKEPQKLPRLFFLSFYLSTRWISQQPVTKAMRFGSHTAKVAGMTWPFPRASRKVMMA